jgi:hypothetical protein
VLPRKAIVIDLHKFIVLTPVYFLISIEKMLADKGLIFYKKASKNIGVRYNYINKIRRNQGS